MRLPTSFLLLVHVLAVVVFFVVAIVVNAQDWGGTADPTPSVTCGCGTNSFSPCECGHWNKRTVFPPSSSCEPCPRLQCCGGGTSSQINNVQPGQFAPGGQRVCKNAAGDYHCPFCRPGTYSNAGTQSDALATCWLCRRGSYAPNQGATSCINCNPGYTTASEGQASSQDCTPCPYGTFEVEKGQRCENCPLGTFGPTTGAYVKSQACHECPAGSYGSSTPIKECTLCRNGTYSGAGASKCTPCPPGWFSNKLGAKYLSDENRSECEPCPVGTDQSAEGGTTCNDCRVGHANNNMNASNCEACAPGFYTNKTRQRWCEKCPAGTFQNQSASITCSDCPPGTFEDRLNSIKCKKCPPGTFNAFPRGTSIDACLPCKTGTWSGAEGAAACVPCASGSSNSDLRRTTPCELCSPGSYQPSQQQDYCAKCPAGTFLPWRGATHEDNCSACAGGSWSFGMSSNCTLCPLGHWSPKKSTTSADCTECERGYFCANATHGCELCDKCPSEHFSYAGASECYTVTREMTRTNTSSDRPSMFSATAGTATASADRKAVGSRTATASLRHTATRSISLWFPPARRHASAVAGVEATTAVVAAMSVVATGGARFASGIQKVVAVENMLSCGATDEQGDLLPPPALDFSQNFLGISFGSEMLATYRGAIVGNSLIIAGLFLIGTGAAALRMQTDKKNRDMDFWLAFSKVRMPGQILIPLVIVSPPIASSAAVITNKVDLKADKQEIGLVIFALIVGCAWPAVWFLWIMFRARQIKLTTTDLNTFVGDTAVFKSFFRGLGQLASGNGGGGDDDDVDGDGSNNKNKNKNKNKGSSSSSSTCWRGIARVWEYIADPITGWKKCDFSRSQGPAFESYNCIWFATMETFCVVSLSVLQGITMTCRTDACCSKSIFSAVGVAVLHLASIVYGRNPYTTRTERVINPAVSAMTVVLAVLVALQHLQARSIDKDLISRWSNAAFFLSIIAMAVALIWQLLPAIQYVTKMCRKKTVEELIEEGEERLNNSSNNGGDDEHDNNGGDDDGDDEEEELVDIVNGPNEVPLLGVTVMKPRTERELQRKYESVMRKHQTFYEKLQMEEARAMRQLMEVELLDRTELSAMLESAATLKKKTKKATADLQHQPQQEQRHKSSGKKRQPHSAASAVAAPVQLPTPNNNSNKKVRSFSASGRAYHDL